VIAGDRSRPRRRHAGAPLDVALPRASSASPMVARPEIKEPPRWRGRARPRREHDTVGSPRHAATIEARPRSELFSWSRATPGRSPPASACLWELDQRCPPPRVRRGSTRGSQVPARAPQPTARRVRGERVHHRRIGSDGNVKCPRVVRVGALLDRRADLAEPARRVASIIWRSPCSTLATSRSNGSVGAGSDATRSSKVEPAHVRQADRGPVPRGRAGTSVGAVPGSRATASTARRAQATSGVRDCPRSTHRGRECTGPALPPAPARTARCNGRHGEPGRLRGLREASTAHGDIGAEARGHLEGGRSPGAGAARKRTLARCGHLVGHIVVDVGRGGRPVPRSAIRIVAEGLREQHVRPATLLEGRVTVDRRAPTDAEREPIAREDDEARPLGRSQVRGVEPAGGGGAEDAATSPESSAAASNSIWRVASGRAAVRRTYASSSREGSAIAPSASSLGAAPAARGGSPRGGQHRPPAFRVEVTTVGGRAGRTRRWRTEGASRTAGNPARCSAPCGLTRGDEVATRSAPRRRARRRGRSPTPRPGDGVVDETRDRRVAGGLGQQGQDRRRSEAVRAGCLEAHRRAAPPVGRAGSPPR
jgi:hypothetical protein